MKDGLVARKAGTRCAQSCVGSGASVQKYTTLAALRAFMFEASMV